jgi:integrase
VSPRRPHGTGAVYERSDGLWIGTIEAGWTANNTRRRITVSGKNATDVKRKLRDKQREIARTGIPAGEVSASTTVRTWAEKWLTDTRANLRPTSWANNRSAVRQWIVPAIGNKRLDLLSPTDVRSVSRGVLAAGKSVGTARRAHAVLTKMLKDAILDGATVPPRVLLVAAPAATENDRDAIPMPDTLDILKAASLRPDASRWVAAFLQGMRQGECLGLTWKCVDLEAGTIDVSWQLDALPYNVPHDTSSGFATPDGFVSKQLDGAWHLVRPKTESGQRIIPLTPWMTTALAAWREVAPKSKHGLVWPASDGRPKVDKDDRADWYALQDAAQVAAVEDEGGRRYTLHEARHRCATLLRELHVDDETIIAIMGHASILSTKAYLHTSTDRTRKAMEDMGARLGLIEGSTV